MQAHNLPDTKTSSSSSVTTNLRDTKDVKQTATEIHAQQFVVMKKLLAQLFPEEGASSFTSKERAIAELSKEIKNFKKTQFREPAQKISRHLEALQDDYLRLQQSICELQRFEPSLIDKNKLEIALHDAKAKLQKFYDAALKAINDAMHNQEKFQSITLKDLILLSSQLQNGVFDYKGNIEPELSLLINETHSTFLYVSTACDHFLSATQQQYDAIKKDVDLALAKHQIRLQDQEKKLTPEEKKAAEVSNVAEIKILQTELKAAKNDAQHLRAQLEKYQVASASATKELTATAGELQQTMLKQQVMLAKLEQNQQQLEKENRDQKVAIARLEKQLQNAAKKEEQPRSSVCTRLFGKKT